ncbi:DUF881 domain-containing protein [Nocardioides sp. SYSU D00038]|uniref:DUF881 domain-containing protein n=1 Tax=Nocardioides sp. SYSU D00038 TaxID=2812554 RepID=UPI0019682F57|nr:DUF881 domain-containing protein [Nocardioides sp. SYSU D00038]
MPGPWDRHDPDRHDPDRDRSGAGERLPSRVTMPLLDRIVEDSLEQDYRVVAERHGRVAGSGRTPARPALVVAVLVVVGLLGAMAVLQTTANRETDELSRAALIERITARREALAAQQEEIATLRSGNASSAETATALAGALQAARARLRSLQVATGFVAVSGEGVRFTVDDPPGSDDITRVRAADLHQLVNGLWAAGAEAIAVNGARLTALSPFSDSGDAIQVNAAPLTPPYVVSAIGDTRDLQANLLQTYSGVRFEALADQYGFVVERQNVDRLTLPSAPSSQVRGLRSLQPRDARTPMLTQEGGP